MAIWKQIIAALCVTAIALAGWSFLAPATLPGPVAGMARELGLVRAPAASPEDTGAPRRGGAGPQRVVSAAVSAVEATRRVRSVGSAEARRSVTLFAPSAGLVTAVLFEPGARVEEGDVLLRLDDREERIALEQASIALEQAQERLARVERLSETQAVSVVQVEDARAERAAAQAQHDRAALALERRTLPAPFPGHMGLAQVSVGDRVTTTTPIANIDDRATILVRYSLPERHAGRVAIGTPVVATTVAFGDTTFSGEIAEIDSRVDPQTRTLTVRAAIDNRDDRLRPGMGFIVETPFTGETWAAVPLLALQWDRDGSFVWREANGRVARIEVTIIERGPERALVEGPLQPGDRVVVEGVQRLREGAEVTVVGRDDDTRERS